MKKRTKQIIVLVLSIVAIIGSVSYALWSKSEIQESTNEVGSGCFDVDIALDDVAIGLGNTYPITDEEGNNLKPYVVTLKNKCTIDAKYDINLNLLEVANPMNDSSIKVSVDEEAKILTNYTVNNSYDSNTYRGSYTIYSGTLKANKNDRENGQSKTHNIRIWMNQDASENEAEKKFMAKISVDATPTDPGKLDRDKFKNYIATLATSHEETRNEQICNWIEDSSHENGGYNDCHYEDVTGTVYEVTNYIEKVYTVLTNEVPANAISSSDVSETGNGEVMAWYLDEDSNGMYELYIGSKGGVAAPMDSSYLFDDSVCGRWECQQINQYLTYIDVSNLDVSNVTNMESMFYYAGMHANYNLDLSNWDVSRVTSCSHFNSGVASKIISPFN